MVNIKFKETTTIVYSNPKRPLWRKSVTHAAGEIICCVDNLYVVGTTRQYDPRCAHPGLCVEFRWYKTPKTYWYAFFVNAESIEIL